MRLDTELPGPSCGWTQDCPPDGAGAAAWDVYLDGIQQEVPDARNVPFIFKGQAWMIVGGINNRSEDILVELSAGTPQAEAAWIRRAQGANNDTYLYEERTEETTYCSENGSGPPDLFDPAVQRLLLSRTQHFSPTHDGGVVGRPRAAVKLLNAKKNAEQRAIVLWGMPPGEYDHIPEGQPGLTPRAAEMIADRKLQNSLGVRLVPPFGYLCGSEKTTDNFHYRRLSPDEIALNKRYHSPGGKAPGKRFCGNTEGDVPWYGSLENGEVEDEVAQRHLSSSELGLSKKFGSNTEGDGPVEDKVTQRHLSSSEQGLSKEFGSNS